MRSTKAAVAILIFIPMLVIALSARRHSLEVWAQIGNPLGNQVTAPLAPLPPPAPVPGAPPTPARLQPGAFPTIGAIPQLAPAPFSTPLPLAQPTASPRAFSCSCYGPASATRWMGTVQAGTYFQARQGAVNQCLAFNIDRRPSSAFIPPPQFAFFPTPAPPIASSLAEPGLPNLTAPGISGFSLLNSSRNVYIGLCSQCTCS